MTVTGKVFVDAPSRERGIALLVVLWIIVATSLIVSAFNATVKSGVNFIGSEVELAKADALLDAGAEIAATRLIDDEDRRWLPDGLPHPIAFAGANLTIAIVDAGSRIDLNKADGDLLFGLLRQFASSETQAMRVRDRILLARGDKPSKNSTTDAGFGEQEERPRSENQAFLDVAQLRGLEGVTVELYRRIAPYLTVYSSDGRINPASAPDAVLMSIPRVKSSDVEQLRAFSRSPERREELLSELEQSVGSYLSEKAGPAFVVTVKLLNSSGRSETGRDYVIVPNFDKDAPYRLISKRPIGSYTWAGTS